jgi:hypothetical protein
MERFVERRAGALNNRSPCPVLADAMADAIVRMLAYDNGQFRLDANLISNVVPSVQ